MHLCALDTAWLLPGHRARQFTLSEDRLILRSSHNCRTYYLTLTRCSRSPFTANSPFHGGSSTRPPKPCGGDPHQPVSPRRGVAVSGRHPVKVPRYLHYQQFIRSCWPNRDEIRFGVFRSSAALSERRHDVQTSPLHSVPQVNLSKLD